MTKIKFDEVEKALLELTDHAKRYEKSDIGQLQVISTSNLLIVTLLLKLCQKLDITE